MKPLKGYKVELTSRWWLKHRFFKLYMLREATVLPLVFFIGAMLKGVYSLQNAVQFNAWQAFMSHPLVITLNILALLAALYHAFTFFVLFPRVMPIHIGAKAVPANLIVIAQWLAVVGATSAFVALFLIMGA